MPGGRRWVERCIKGVYTSTQYVGAPGREDLPGIESMYHRRQPPTENEGTGDSHSCATSSTYRLAEAPLLDTITSAKRYASASATCPTECGSIWSGDANRRRAMNCKSDLIKGFDSPVSHGVQAQFATSHDLDLRAHTVRVVFRMPESLEPLRIPPIVVPNDPSL